MISELSERSERLVLSKVGFISDGVADDSENKQSEMSSPRRKKLFGGVKITENYKPERDPLRRVPAVASPPYSAFFRMAAVSSSSSVYRRISAALARTENQV